MPSTNTKMKNTKLLRTYGAGSIHVKCVEKNCTRRRARKGVVTYNFQVQKTVNFSNSNSNCGNGVSSAEVALATRAFFQLRFREKLLENVEMLMHGQGWDFILIPSYMPTFHPIETVLAVRQAVSISTSRLPVI